MPRLPKVLDEETRWKLYRSIPKSDWETLCGRDRTTLRQQANRYGFPIGKGSVDLQKFLSYFSDWLAENQGRLRSTKGGEDHPKIKAEIRLKEASAREKELAVAERLGQTISRSRVHEMLTILAGTLKDAGERLEKHHGTEALEILNDSLDEFERLTDQLFDSYSNTGSGA